MAELLTRLEIEDLKENLREVRELLHRHALVENLVGRQEMPRRALVEQLVHKQHLAELRAKLDRLHPADIAYILEALPLGERLVVWELVKADRDGGILLEGSDAVRDSLIADMDVDALADLAPDLPAEVVLRCSWFDQERRGDAARCSPLALQGVVEPPDMFGEDRLRKAGRIRRRQLEPGIRLTARRGDAHALLARQVDHRGILGEAMHEQLSNTPVACVRVAAREQHCSNAGSAPGGKHRDTELRMRIAAREVRRPDKAELIVEDAENRVAVEADTCDIVPDRLIGQDNAETQPPIFVIEGEQVPLERIAFQPAKFARNDLRGHSVILFDSENDARFGGSSQLTAANAARAADRVASISTLPCAAETNPAS